MNTSWFVKTALILLCLAAAGPELGVGLEMIGLLNLMGVELFLFAFLVPVLTYGSAFFSKLQYLDPYFFLSPREDIARVPALLFHGIPFFIATLFLVLQSSLLSFLIGEKLLNNN